MSATSSKAISRYEAELEGLPDSAWYPISRALERHGIDIQDFEKGSGICMRHTVVAEMAVLKVLASCDDAEEHTQIVLAKMKTFVSCFKAPSGGWAKDAVVELSDLRRKLWELLEDPRCVGNTKTLTAAIDFLDEKIADARKPAR